MFINLLLKTQYFFSLINKNTTKKQYSIKSIILIDIPMFSIKSAIEIKETQIKIIIAFK